MATLHDDGWIEVPTNDPVLLKMDGATIQGYNLRFKPIVDANHRCICPGVYGGLGDQCCDRATQEDMLCDHCRTEPQCIAARNLDEARKQMGERR